MLVEKTRKVKTPERGTKLSAGIDFFIPEFTEDEFRDLNRDIVDRVNNRDTAIIIAPNSRKAIPSGIKVKINAGNVLIAYNKSGVATKKGLLVGACVVDADYQGEVFIHLVNPSNVFVELHRGTKAVQFVETRVELGMIMQATNIHPTESERGEGKCGSTGA